MTGACLPCVLFWFALFVLGTLALILAVKR